MDKYEYKLRLEEIKALNKKGRFQEAAQVADTIDWKKVRNVTTLGIVSDVYKVNRRFEDAKEILLLANDKSPQNRRILYSLCDLTIKLGQVVEAVEYYKEFVQLSPNDNNKYILLYKIYEAQDISLEERIAVLKEYKKREYNEKWAYELAFLYHRVGLATECVEECDQLILWFGEGKYVTKAMELKRLYVPLSPAQQQAYDRQFGKQPQEEIREKAPEEEPAEEEKPTPQGDELDIQVKTMDIGQYNTINLQAALAESMREVLEPPRQEEQPALADVLPVRADQETPRRQAEDRRNAYGGDDVEYQEDVTRVIRDSAGWNVQETGQLEMDGQEEEKPEASVQQSPVKELRLPESAKEAFSQEPEEESRRAPQPSSKSNRHQERMSDLLSQEYDGQISLVLPEERKVEKQITGQMNFQDVMAEWEARKKANEEKRKASLRKTILDQTEPMFVRYDESVKNGIPQKLERGESITPVQPVKAAPANAAARVEQAVQGVIDELRADQMAQTASQRPAQTEVRETPTARETAPAPQAEQQAAASAPQVEQPAAAPAPQAEQPTAPAPQAEQPEAAPAPQAEQPEAAPAPQAEQPEVAPAPQVEQPEATPAPQAEQAAAAPVPQAEQSAEASASQAEQPTEAPQAQTEEPAEAAARQEETAKVGEDTAALNARITEQQVEDHVRSMTKEEKELFAPYVPTKGTMRQLLNALDRISLSAYTGNMIITGTPNSDMMKLAKNIVREIKLSDQNFSGKAARISGDVLSVKKPEELIKRIPNGALIVEQAGRLSDEGAQNLARALDQEQTGIVVFLLDSKRSVNALLERCPKLTEYFTSRFDIAALDSGTLVKYGCQYAYNQEYAIDELGRLALHTRIEDMQTSDHAVTVEEVREIVDDAIAHAERFSIKHMADIVLQKRYDEDDMIVLRERDFMHKR